MKQITLILDYDETITVLAAIKNVVNSLEGDRLQDIYQDVYSVIDNQLIEQI